MATMTAVRRVITLRSAGMLTAPRLEEILARQSAARVAVLGDFCLDVYWLLDMTTSEPSLETGTPTRPVRTQRHSLGGAGNVAANLAALGVGAIHAFAVLGSDPFGDCLQALLRARNVHCDDVLCAPDPALWQTPAYCKPYEGETELPRFDMGTFNRLPDPLATELLTRLAARLAEFDVVLVNQQLRRGIHTETLRSGLQRLMETHPTTRFIFDGRHETDSYPLAWLKLNAHEALQRCGIRREPQELVLRDEALQAAETLFGMNRKPVFLTRGNRGCVVCTDDGITEVPGLQMIGPSDSVGAGDSFLAGLAGALAVGATPAEAAQVGNFAARVVVSKRKETGTADAAELLAVGRAPAYVYEPELADDPRRAVYWQGTSIEVVTEAPAQSRFRVAIFDHDGTLSTLRQGWEAVMEPMMVQAILGPSYAAADEGLYHRVVDRVRCTIDQTTGIQTLAQMQTLAELVREFRLVPDADIRDMHGYKALYDAALMAKIKRRLEQLRAGELEARDFCLKNAPEFLRALQAAGITLYLVSGTDQEHVAAEARALGYVGCFEGRIYGAVGDIRYEAKRLVLERLLQDMGSLGEHVVMFGDGPVEIRETRLRGGFAVGVASDEVRRFGWNPAKRARLVRAGAVALVSDYAQLSALLRFLQIQPAAEHTTATAE